MLMTMNLKREYTAILQNASKVSYTKLKNQIGDLSFEMPLFDTKNSMIETLQWVELTDNQGEYIGLYRIMPSQTKKDATNNTISYTATHALSTLLDDVLFGYHEVINRTTTEAINYLLSKQSTKNWILKKCDFKRYFSYSWENENGLADALFSIPKAFDEDYRFEWNTQLYPFELSLLKVKTEPTCRIQEGYNLESLQVDVDPTNLVNRIYPLGAGEGVNQLNIKSVNGGKEYVEDAASIKKYGLQKYIWVDSRFTIAQSLKDNANAMLKKWSSPKITWTIKAVDLIKLTDTPLDIDKLREGSVVMINTNDFGSINLTINKESKSDVFGAPHDLNLELGNIGEDINTTMADIQRKQQINETYSQGATTLFNKSYADNCESKYPAIMKFNIDDDVVHINTIDLDFETSAYRGYTQAVKGGGATVKSTSAGGATTQTSSSGGGSTQTSTSGGGGTQTSTSGGGGTQTSTSGGGYSSGSTSSNGGGYSSGSTTSSGGGSTQTSSANGSHRHKMFEMKVGAVAVTTGTRFSAGATELGGDRNVAIFMPDGATGDLWTKDAASNHSHNVNVPSHSHNFNIQVPAHNHGFNISIPSHSHNVSIPSHSHKVTIPNHSHKVTIPNHTHKITLPNHTHKIELPAHTHPLEWGIYEDSERPTQVDIYVDGKKISHNGTSADRLNIVPYLKKDSSGKVTRGKHTIELKPNKRARITADITGRVFIQSQLGGQF